MAVKGELLWHLLHRGLEEYLIEALAVECGLLHRFAFTAKQYQRHSVFAQFTAYTIGIVFLPARIIICNPNRLTAESTTAFRISASALSA